ncbi:MAG: DUF2834 domain-containing protein [Planctomycetota bacterium]
MSKPAVTCALGVLGWVASYALFTKWLAEHGWDFLGGWREAFTASDFATGLIVDLSVTAVMLIVLAVWERKRLGGRWTAAILASLALSVSMALTLYLLALWRAEGAEAEPAA